MIPLHLRIAGFLSYRDPVDLDFESLGLACISGHNGAGKSSLLDSITWVLFGEARGKGMEIINSYQDVKAAEVALTFEYENNIYRVQRTLPRGKSTVLEFQVKDGENWKPLTEKTTRETQERIEQTLRLDYETFINASFFLQGKADQFTQKKASERKAVLSTILGLEIWDRYKERAAEKRKLLENDVNEIDGRMAEIDAELSEEDMRKSRLIELETTLNQLSSTRAAQEAALENIRKNAALLNEQRKLAVTLFTSLERSRSALAGLESRLSEKEMERTTYADLVDRAKEIESGYKAWQKARMELEAWEEIAKEFREHEKDRAPLLGQIAVEKARLEEEQRSLRAEEEAIRNQKSAMENLETEIQNARTLLKLAEKKINERIELETQRNAGREKQAELRAENDALKTNMNELKERIETLKSSQGAECPLCGQALSREHRKSTLKQLEADGREKGDRFRANKSQVDDLEKQTRDLEMQINKLISADNERVQYSKTVSQLTERIETLQSIGKEWEKTGKRRLAEMTRELEKESFAVEARKKLTKLDKELGKLGYDTFAHDAKRKEELDLRSMDEDHRKLDSARQVTKQIEGEINNIRSEIANRKSEIAEQEKSYHKAAKALTEAEAQSPDINAAERELFTIREDENRTRDQVGAARQKVDVLFTLRTRKADYEAQSEELNRKIMRHKTLERAFGKDGVPALLIEQSLPQIEAKANDLLDRLSNGQMSIRFVTQESYKDKKRDDLRETLDIQISDSAGLRDYEMYSGGEAFRVNFAIRLALSEILAQRKGARLQTLVIDEGFGSQDAQGRQRLIEAINVVKNDFAKILVITHLEELKDAFPNRIEVEKTDRGSIVHVI
jgi:DNA repair protein SbcC/Rad50